MKTRPIVFRFVLIAMLLSLAALGEQGRIRAASAANDDDQIIAIGVALQPETALIRYAEEINAELRSNYPRGYELEQGHTPHITLVQRFVRSSDLSAIAGAVAQVIEEGRPTTFQLTVDSYVSSDWGGLGVMALNVEVMPQLRRFEGNIVDAVQPFATERGTIQAFAVSTGDIAINQDALDRVERYVPEYSGRNFTVNMIMGVAQTRFLNALKARPIVPFTFGINGVEIYQLGPYGEPQRLIWSSNPGGCWRPCAQ